MDTHDISAEERHKLFLAAHGFETTADYLASARARQEADVRSGKRSAASLTIFSPARIRAAKVTFPDARTMFAVCEW